MKTGHNPGNGRIRSIKENYLFSLTGYFLPVLIQPGNFKKVIIRL